MWIQTKTLNQDITAVIQCKGSVMNPYYCPQPSQSQLHCNVPQIETVTLGAKGYPNPDTDSKQKHFQM